VRKTLALLLALLPLAGCGGDVTAIDPIAQAAQRTTDVAGAHFVMTARIAAEGEVVEFRGPGEIGDHGRKFHMTMTMPAAILGMKGVEGKSVTFEAVGAGKSFYFRGGPFTEIAKGKWLRMKDEDPSFNLGQNDPSKMLEYLRGTSKVEERGEETIRGVETRHYEARIQLDKIAERVSPEAAKTLKQATEGAGIKEIPVEVWVDDDSLVRKLKMDWHPKGGSFVMQMELFDFGDVDIDVPARSETTTLEQLLGGG
jgi:hypothetical protein